MSISFSTYLNIEELFSQHGGSVVDWVSRSIESSTKHFNAHWHSEHITGELAGGRHVVNIGGTLENLMQHKKRMMRKDVVDIDGDERISYWMHLHYVPVQWLAFP